jgi:type VI secretion system secreted protein Hcp
LIFTKLIFWHLFEDEAVVTSTTSGGDMAIDVYLQIEGINGESADGKHKGWIEVSHVIWNVNQSRASTMSTAGGLSCGRAELSEITFRKMADLSSPLLLQNCATGKTIAKAKFEFMRADGNGTPITYFTVELDNVMVSSVTPSSGDGGILSESVSLAYAKVKWKYTQQKIAGGIGGNTSGGWDAAANKIAA